MDLRKLLLVVGVPLAAPAGSALADQTIRCESHRKERQECRVRDIEDKHVRLKRTLGKADCDRGRSWGTDHRGIWVDHGCKAEFEISSRGRGHDREEQDGVPGFVARACTRAAEREGDERRGVRSVHLSRVERVWRKGDEWRLDAHYELRTRDGERRKLGRCRVDQSGHVTHFAFK